MQNTLNIKHLLKHKDYIFVYKSNLVIKIKLLKAFFSKDKKLTFRMIYCKTNPL